MSKDYSAEIMSEPIKGKVKLALEIDGLVVSALIDSYYIPHGVIKSFSRQDRYVRIFTADRQSIV